MGQKDFTNFVDEIPDNKLENFPETQNTLYPKPAGDSNFRLDMQGKTATAQYNLQIQANSGAKKTSVRITAPRTWATVLVAKNSQATPADIRAAFKNAHDTSTIVTV